MPLAGTRESRREWREALLRSKLVDELYQLYHGGMPRGDEWEMLRAIHDMLKRNLDMRMLLDETEKVLTDFEKGDRI
jgi:hypothetical protein